MCSSTSERSIWRPDDIHTSTPVLINLCRSADLGWWFDRRLFWSFILQRLKCWYVNNEKIKGGKDCSDWIEGRTNVIFRFVFKFWGCSLCSSSKSKRAESCSTLYVFDHTLNSNRCRKSVSCSTHGVCVESPDSLVQAENVGSSPTLIWTLVLNAAVVTVGWQRQKILVWVDFPVSSWGCCGAWDLISSFESMSSFCSGALD